MQWTYAGTAQLSNGRYRTTFTVTGGAVEITSVYREHHIDAVHDFIHSQDLTDSDPAAFNHDLAQLPPGPEAPQRPLRPGHCDWCGQDVHDTVRLSVEDDYLSPLALVCRPCEHDYRKSPLSRHGF